MSKTLYAKYLTDTVLPNVKLAYETQAPGSRVIAKNNQISETTVLKWAKEFGWKRYQAPVVKKEPLVEKKKEEPAPFIPKEAIKNKNTEEALNRQRKEKEEVLKELEELYMAHDIALGLTKPISYTIPEILFNEHEKHQGIGIIQYSDWHVEERVEKKTTHGLNEYNPDIARRRVDKLTENTIKLIRKERQDINLDKLLIVLGGDMINSFLHDHDVQQNYMAPIEACEFAKELICRSLATIAEYADVQSIDVMCIRGNHPRLTKKMSSSTDYKMNLEALIYNSVKQDEKMKSDIFKWHIPESQFGYIKIGNKTVRAMHGHEINYKGGIGGITIPLVKAVMRLNDTMKADYTCMHHYHTLDMIGACNTSINGSLVGYNSYAMAIQAKFDTPKQAFQLLDMERGFTTRIPIFCE
jgi:hypothetical protein